ncbi:hypothetical protein [uncultured Nitratireductor sp.]|uniref:hypothetical protein n=1 Tax=uncultured Nitratireductor sp. TaxID=520953 RepID=UPI0025D16B27|nr:hypothetical protein [uncultured Nitratireductor sp.]
MKLFVPSALVLALVGSFGYLSDADTAKDATGFAVAKAVDEKLAGSELTLVRIGLDGVCKVRRSQTPDRTELDLDERCTQILPSLAEARIWEERADGTVAFVSANGETLVEFFPGDGVSYQSLRPRTPLLSMYRGT